MPSASLRVASPLATFRISSKICRPFSWTLTVPSTISPQLMSMSSVIRSYSGVFVASLIEGDGLQP